MEVEQQQMDYKYDAFISYRHAEKDTLIASEIQTSLERFRIPKELRKKTGKQRFNRVFRDVEELPISSNLTEDIEEALKSSEYLIVICSHRTSESDWVKREIDTFLELHDYNKQLILTVLVEGEPDEVIPEILRHDNITHYLADGSFYCKDEVVEPLSADYRMPIPKARKIELPRLAATMLGCNYDDIIRRRKAYKRTRLLIETAVISLAAIALLTYIGIMFMRIQDGLRNTQLNQSRYLASESQKLLEDGDRIGAIQLALAALENSDGTLRPVTSEAEYALSTALGAYTTKGTTYSAPVWRYEIASAIVKYDCSSNAKNVAALDTSGKLHIWDRKDHKETVYENDGSRDMDFAYDKNDDLIIVSAGNVALYDSKTMKEKWKFQPGQELPSRDKLMKYYPGAGYIVLNDNEILYVINATDGKVIKELDTRSYPVFAEKNTDLTKSFIIYDFEVSKDFSKIVLTGNMNGYNNYAIFVYEVKTDKWTGLMNDSGYILNASFDDDGNLMVLRRSKEDPDANEKASNNEPYDAPVILELFSSSGRSSWKTELSSINRVVNSNLISLNYTTKDEKQTPVIAAAYSNRIVMVNRKDGKLIKSYDLLESVVTSYTLDDTLFVLTRNGMALWFPLDEGRRTITSYKYFKDGILDLLIVKEDGFSSYLVKDPSKRVITEYSGRFSDTKYIGVKGSESLGRVINCIKCGDYLITFESNLKISGTDLKTKKVLWTIDRPTKDFYNMDAFSPDKKSVFLVQTETSAGANKHTLVKLDCTSGKITQANSEFSFSEYDYMDLSGNTIWALVSSRNKDEFTLYCYNTADDSVKKLAVDISSLSGAAVKDILKVSPDGKHALIYCMKSDGGKFKEFRLMVDTANGKFTSTECHESNGAIWNEKGTQFAELSKDGSIRIFNAKGEQKAAIDAEMRTPRKIIFHEDKLYVLYNVDVLCSYDSKGRQLINIDLGHGDIDPKTSYYDFNFVRGYLFVTAGDNTDIIDISSSKSISTFKGFLCLYNTSQNNQDLSATQVLCKSFIKDEGPMLGYFEYKTHIRLIDQAKEYLKSNGVTMSDEFKRRYGIT